MKYLILILSAVLSFNTAQARSALLLSQTDSIYTQVDQTAEYVGGQKKLDKYYVKTIRYPAKALETNTQGTVVLLAVVEKDGTISNLKVKTSVSPELDAEASRVILQSPKWVPAQKNGIAVRSYREIPVAFKLANF